MRVAAGQYRSARWPVISSANGKHKHWCSQDMWEQRKTGSYVPEGYEPNSLFHMVIEAGVFFPMCPLFVSWTDSMVLIIFFSMPRMTLSKQLISILKQLFTGETISYWTRQAHYLQCRRNWIPNWIYLKASGGGACMLGVCQYLSHGAVCPQGRTVSSSVMSYRVCEPRWFQHN